MSELLFPSVPSHRLERDSSRWLRYALLATENKILWIFKAAVLSSGHKHVVSTVLLVEICGNLGTLLFPFFLACEALDLTVVDSGKSLKFPGTK